MLISLSYSCQSTNSLLLTVHFHKIQQKEKKKIYDMEQDLWHVGPRVAADYTLKSSCLKLSNLWALECPCGEQEALKVVAKLVRKKNKIKLTCPSAEGTRALQQHLFTPVKVSSDPPVHSGGRYAA